MHIDKPESNEKDEAQYAATTAISAEEVQSIANWLNKVESVHAYERFKKGNLVFIESFNKPDNVAEISEPASTLQPEESANISKMQAETIAREDMLVIELNLKSTPTYLESQDQEIKGSDEYVGKYTEIEGLITGIEASFENLDQEIVGELLIEMLTTENITSNKDETRDISLTNPTKKAGLLESKHETAQDPIVKFNDFLDRYEPELKIQVTEVLSSISETITEFKLDTEISEDDKERLISKLEVHISELFASFGIVLKAEQTRKYIELLLLAIDNEELILREYSIDYLNIMGTKEYRASRGNSLLLGLASVTYMGLNHAELIGKYTIQACFA